MMDEDFAVGLLASAGSADRALERIIDGAVAHRVNSMRQCIRSQARLFRMSRGLSEAEREGAELDRLTREAVKWMYGYWVGRGIRPGDVLVASWLP